jgi:phosphatidylglycerol:prolipoprotein diacylglycerol transferase
MFPELLQIGRFTPYSYGVLIFLGYLVAIWWPTHLAKKEGIPPIKMEGLGPVIVLTAGIGSKLLTALDCAGFYSGDWNHVWSQASGRGGVFYGGFLLAVASSGLYFWLTRLLGWRVADCVAPRLALAQGIGRVDCFLAGCRWGIPTQLSFGVTFASEVAHRITGVPLHNLGKAAPIQTSTRSRSQQNSSKSRLSGPSVPDRLSLITTFQPEGANPPA